MSRGKRIVSKKMAKPTVEPMVHKPTKRRAPTKTKYAKASKRKSKKQTKFGISDVLNAVKNTLSHKKEEPITAVVPYTTNWQFWQPPQPTPMQKIMNFVGNAIPIIRYISMAVGLGFQGYNLVKMILSKLNKNPLDYDTRRTNQMIDTMQRKLLDKNPDFRNDDIFGQFEDLRRLLYMIDNMQDSGQIGGIDQVIANATEGLKSVLVRFNQLMNS